MNAEDNKQLTKWIKGLFPSVTQEQKDYLASVFSGYSKNVAESVIKTHRANHDFLDIPQLITGLRSAAEREKTMKQNRSQELVIDWLQRNEPASYGDGGIQSLMKHFSKCWDAVQRETSDQMAVVKIRKLMFAHAVRAFGEIHLSREEAMEAALDCIPALAVEAKDEPMLRSV